MATERRETINRRRNRNKVYKIISYIILAGLVVIGFTAGRLTAPEKIEVQEIETVKTVEVPVEVDSLPADYKVDYFDVPLSHSLQKYIYEICADEDFPVTLAIAMIDVESEFNPEIVSKTNDYGLMQINEVNFTQLAEDYHTADLTNPYQNVFCGVKIISSYVDKYEGDYTKALMCYNLGEYGAKKAWESGITETDYTKKIMKKWEEYKNGNGNEAG